MRAFYFLYMNLFISIFVINLCSTQLLVLSYFFTLSVLFFSFCCCCFCFCGSRPFILVHLLSVVLTCSASAFSEAANKLIGGIVYMQRERLRARLTRLHSKSELL